MRKAFRSSTIQDQQVLSKNSTPKAVAEMHNSSDKPPPLSNLTSYRCCTKTATSELVTFSVRRLVLCGMLFFFKYREDSTDAMKFYSDPSYFFDLWREKMLQDTEEKRRERRRQRVRAESCVMFCVFIG